MTFNPELDEERLAALPAHEQKQIRQALEELASQVERNPLNTYFPHEKQAEFHEAREAVKAFIGGNRSGKSTAGVADDLIQALDRADVPEHLLKFKYREPPFYGRVITPDLGHTMEVVIDKFRVMCPAEALLGSAWDKAFDKTRRIARFKNGSRIDFMSTEQDPNKFGGIALHRVHYDEEPSGPNAEKIRQESTTRLIDYNGDEVFTMTPQFGLSFIYDQVWERRHEPGFWCKQVSMDDNPHLSEKGKEQYFSSLNLTDEEKRMRREGEFVHLGGLFFDEYRDALHLRRGVAPKDIEGQNVVVAIDPGLKRTAVLWVAFDNDNAALAFAELYESEALPPQIAARIKQVNAEWNIQPSYVIDPSARNRATVNAEQVEAEYAREGVYCQHAQNSRPAGILEVKRRLQRGELVFSDAVRNTLWEIGRYRRDPNAPDEFQAIKEDDHLMDCLRYACMARAWHIPKQRRHSNNFNSDPSFEPPWRGGPVRQQNPPLGSMS